jgi:hypothetical protein
MRLFESIAFEPGVPLDDRVSTLLGNLEISLKIDSMHFTFDGVQAFRHQTREAQIRQLQTPSVLAECFRACFEIPSAGSAVCCEAAIIRLQCNQPEVKASARINWLDGYTWLDSYPESGEGIEAKTWTSKSARVTIGTEDSEYLEARSKTGEWMPPRLSDESLISDAMFNFTESSISVNMPILKNSEAFQLQFVIVSGDVVNDCATWLAVAQKPRVLLSWFDCI